MQNAVTSSLQVCASQGQVTPPEASAEVIGAAGLAVCLVLIGLWQLAQQLAWQLLVVAADASACTDAWYELFGEGHKVLAIHVQ